MSILNFRQNLTEKAKDKAKLVALADPILIFVVSYFVYILTTFPTVQTEDSGELITAAATLDIAHPPGYPLYVLLGKLFSIIIPFGNIAWRINIMSGFFAAATVTILYLFLKKILKNDMVAMGGSLFFGFSNIFWSQAIRAEVYTLNQFFLALIIYVLYLWHTTQENKWLLITALTFGLSLTNHHLMILAGPPILIFVLVRNWKILRSPKLIASTILLFFLGLSVYAYLPIRTALAPYKNPAFIDHSGLYDWDSFIGFIDRKIYGGTINLPTETTDETIKSSLPVWLAGIKDVVTNYGGRLINNNITGLPTLLNIIFREYFYIPLLFFLPGLYYIFKKDWQWGLFISLLFFFYTSVLLIFIGVYPETGTFSNFSAYPFLMSAVFILGIISIMTYSWIKEMMIEPKQFQKLEALLIMPALVAIGANFAPNNESKNYIAYDFNRNALESMPQNGLLLSTGRDNMTFPLYYLQEIEGIRTDVKLEIYYASTPITGQFLQNRLASSGQKSIFMDLAPPDFDKIGIKPYKFIYQYGTDEKLPADNASNFSIRGFRKNMETPDNRLKLLYYIKLALHEEKNPQKRNEYFEKAINEINDHTYLFNFIGDYNRNHGNQEQAIRAYQKSGNTTAIDDIKNKKSEERYPQSGMI